ncbi:MAG: hypothetical protein PVH52_04315 [bacterium]|jgi:hypothetical protein
MTNLNLEEFWRKKTDEELSLAGSRLSDYTEDGRRIIREELHRRGISPPEQKPETPARKSLPLAVVLAIVLGALGMLYVRRFWLSLLISWGALVIIGLPAMLVPRGSVADAIFGIVWIVSLLAIRLIVLPVWAARRVRAINLGAE